MNEGLENDEEKFSMDDPFVPRAENRLEKYNSARAIFYPFFPSTLPIVNSWLGTFFQKELSLHLAFSQIPFNIFGGLDLIEKTLKMTETLPDSTLRNLW